MLSSQVYSHCRTGYYRDGTEERPWEIETVKQISKLLKYRVPYHRVLIISLHVHSESGQKPLARPFDMWFRNSIRMISAEWRKANIVLLSKKEDNENMISLTSMVCRILAQVIREQMDETEQKENIPK